MNTPLPFLVGGAVGDRTGTPEEILEFSNLRFDVPLDLAKKGIRRQSLSPFLKEISC
jgi:hypothetical protein